ncbi:MAG: hypothetical protein JST75_04435 [Bacteroidetes bacterium]|nr:hypothetical protein [Bacteroidota bacterium]
MEEKNSSKSFADFMFKEKRNRFLLWLIVIGTLVQFAVFKSIYPFPDFFLDSYSYIFAASQHWNINIWPIGYSKFLSAFHAITHSSMALVACQYFFLELAGCYFFFTVLYFQKPGKIFTSVMFVFLFFNPLFLYLGNFVNSDAIFAALSLFWVSTLFWIIHRPRFSQIFVQSIILFFAFTVRNNAYFYPLIAALAFILSQQKIWSKVAGSLIPLLLIIPFIFFSGNEARKLSGVKQFSLFTGWQLANNALYMYDKIKIDTTQLPTAATRELDRYSKEFYKNFSADFLDSISWYPGNYFICKPESPLFHFLAFRNTESPYDLTHTTTGVVAWSKASPVFAQYGSYLIQKHPLDFAKHFILPNVMYYFLPPLEKFNLYNQGSDEIGPIIQNWFDYEDPHLTVMSKDLQSNLLFMFPPLFLVINLYFFGCMIWFLIKKKYRETSGDFNRIMIVCTAFLLVNFLFSIIATINVFRYQIFPMVVCLTALLLLVEIINKKERPVLDNSKY